MFINSNTLLRLKSPIKVYIEVASDPCTRVCFIYSWKYRGNGDDIEYDINTAPK